MKRGPRGRGVDSGLGQTGSDPRCSTTTYSKVGGPGGVGRVPDREAATSVLVSGHRVSGRPHSPPGVGATEPLRARVIRPTTDVRGRAATTPVSVVAKAQNNDCV